MIQVLQLSLNYVQIAQQGAQNPRKFFSLTATLVSGTTTSPIGYANFGIACKVRSLRQPVLIPLKTDWICIGTIRIFAFITKPTLTSIQETFPDLEHQAYNLPFIQKSSYVCNTLSLQDRRTNTEINIEVNQKQSNL